MKSERVGYRFVPMPYCLVHWRRLKGEHPPAEAEALFAYIAAHVGKDGYACPSYERIVKEKGWGRSRVAEAIRWLTSRQLLLTTPGQRSFGRRSNSIYRLNTKMLNELGQQVRPFKRGERQVPKRDLGQSRNGTKVSPDSGLRPVPIRDCSIDLQEVKNYKLPKSGCSSRSVAAAEPPAPQTATETTTTTTFGRELNKLTSITANLKGREWRQEAFNSEKRQDSKQEIPSTAPDLSGASSLILTDVFLPPPAAAQNSIKLNNAPRGGAELQLRKSVVELPAEVFRHDLPGWAGTLRHIERAFKSFRNPDGHATAELTLEIPRYLNEWMQAGLSAEDVMAATDRFFARKAKCEYITAGFFKRCMDGEDLAPGRASLAAEQKRQQARSEQRQPYSKGDAVEMFQVEAYAEFTKNDGDKSEMIFDIRSRGFAVYAQWLHDDKGLSLEQAKLEIIAIYSRWLAESRDHTKAFELIEKSAGITDENAEFCKNHLPIWPDWKDSTAQIMESLRGTLSSVLTGKALLVPEAPVETVGDEAIDVFACV